MSDFLSVTAYILAGTFHALGSTDELWAQLVPLLLIVEIPLSLLILTGILRWHLKKNTRPDRVLPVHYSKISCVITCYGEGEAVAKTIITLREQVYPGEIEIIAVVDGAARNLDTYEAAMNCVPSFANEKNRSLTVVPKWQRGGRVSTLNAGLASATGAILINADGDTSFDNDMVMKIVSHFADESVPAVGGALRVRNHADGLIARMQSLEYMISMQGNKTGLAEWNLLNNISGAFGAFRREFLVKIGGWDTHTAEDLDLTVRIKQYFQRHPGMRIPFEPHAVGHTDVPDTVSGLLNQRLRWDGDLLFLYLRKHRYSLTPGLLGTRSFVYTLVYGVIQSILLPVLVVVFSYWMLFSYPHEFVLAIFALIYLLYLAQCAVHFLVYLFVISDRPMKDIWSWPWLLLYPIYTAMIRIWTVVAMGNELFRRGHEESSMAPWWVLKRGNRF